MRCVRTCTWSPKLSDPCTVIVSHCVSCVPSSTWLCTPGPTTHAGAPSSREDDGGVGGGGGEGGGLSLPEAVGSQPLHAAGYSVAAIRAHAAASSICGPSGDSRSHVIRSPHEWEPAAASHTAAVHEAVPQRGLCAGGEGDGSGGLGDGGGGSGEGDGGGGGEGDGGGGGEGDGGGGGGKGDGDGGGLSVPVAVGLQPLHAAGNSVAAIWAHASASSICGPSGDSCSHVIRSPHEWVPAAASHTVAVQEAVPHRDPCDSDDKGSGGLGGGGSASIEK
eukprot:scaffold38150_cov65-Phaeocystis_antarctica.AAC.9